MARQAVATHGVQSATDSNTDIKRRSFILLLAQNEKLTKKREEKEASALM